MQASLAWLRQKLFRWQSDGTSPIRLGQRRIFILPTAAGIQFAVLLIVMLLAAINYQLSLGHLLVFLLAGIGIVGIIHTFRNLYDLEIAGIRAPAVFAGETALFQIRLANQRKFPRPGLIFSASPENPVQAELDAKNEQLIEIPVPTHHRGWLTLPRVRLSTTYPLGLFVAWSYLQPELRCLVYPQAIDTPLPASHDTATAGGPYGQQGDADFSGFRERQPADSLRHVAWKASARDDGQRPLLIKQFTEGNLTHLHLDWQNTDPMLDPEIRISHLCAWVLKADTEQQLYALHLPGQESGLSSGPAHRRQCLEMLALFTP